MAMMPIRIVWHYQLDACSGCSTNTHPKPCGHKAGSYSNVQAFQFHPARVSLIVLMTGKLVVLNYFSNSHCQKVAQTMDFKINESLNPSRCPDVIVVHQVVIQIYQHQVSMLNNRGADTTLLPFHSNKL